MSDTFCPSCGHGLPSAAAYCSRCGRNVQLPETVRVYVPVTEAARDLTVNRGSLDERGDPATEISGAHARQWETTQVPAPNQRPAAWERPTPDANWDRSTVAPATWHDVAAANSASDRRARRPLPPEIGVVSLGLIVLAGLLLYPLSHLGTGVFTGVFSGDRFERAFTALVLEVVAEIAACGVALVLLAVGLLRGSRAAQVLTCAVCGLVVVSEIVAKAQTDVTYAERPSTGVVAAVLVVAALIVLAVSASPNARLWFAQDPKPAGVMFAAITNVYLGAVALVDALLLLVAAPIDRNLGWYGAIFAVVGLALVLTDVPLRNGVTAARTVSLVLYLALAITVLIFGVEQHQLATAGTVLPLGLVITAGGALAFPQSSIAHFANPVHTVRRNPAALVGIAVLCAGVLAATAFGFGATGSSSFADTPSANAPVVPDFSDSPDSDEETQASPIDQSQATTEATETLDELEGNGYSATSCSGDLPSLSITDYTIGEVDEQTAGTYTVSAQVTLDSGAQETVTFDVGTAAAGGACVETSTFAESSSSGSSDGGSAAAVSEPSDVPSVPSTGDPVPTDASLPDTPESSSVVSYTDKGDIPQTAAQMVEWQPQHMNTIQTSAVRSIVGFMTYINRQHFQSAWEYSTYALKGYQASSSFRSGYRTSHFYQVAFGQPEQLGDGLVAVPARFVSRQEPAAQGYPAGVTSCTYWPQYVYLVANRGGQWLVDTDGTYFDSPRVEPLKRYSDGSSYLNPISQRVAC